MGLTSIRNKTADGNYLLWQADVLRFPGDDIFPARLIVAEPC